MPVRRLEIMNVALRVQGARVIYSSPQCQFEQAGARSVRLSSTISKNILRKYRWGQTGERNDPPLVRPEFYMSTFFAITQALVMSISVSYGLFTYTLCQHRVHHSSINLGPRAHCRFMFLFANMAPLGTNIEVESSIPGIVYKCSGNTTQQ